MAVGSIRGLVEALKGLKNEHSGEEELLKGQHGHTESYFKLLNQRSSIKKPFEYDFRLKTLRISKVRAKNDRKSSATN